MICPSCKTAGKLTADANARGNGVGVALLRVKASEEHGFCRGGDWCDCQHFVGEALNRIAMNATAAGGSAVGKLSNAGT